MTLQTVEKQVAEAVIMQFDFAADMAEGETITGVTSVTPVNQGEVGGSSNVSCGSNSASGQIAQTIVSGGTNLELYKISCLVVTSAGQTLETEGFMRVRNK